MPIEILNLRVALGSTVFWSDLRKLKIERLLRHTALHITLHDNGRFTELLVILWFNQLEEHVHRCLVPSQWRSENITNDCTIARLKLSLHDLLYRLVFLVLNEWLKWPCMARLILNCELNSGIPTLNNIHSHEIARSEHRHLQELSTVNVEVRRIGSPSLIDIGCIVGSFILVRKSFLKLFLDLLPDKFINTLRSCSWEGIIVLLSLLFLFSLLFGFWPERVKLRVFPRSRLIKIRVLLLAAQILVENLGHDAALQGFLLMLNDICVSILKVFIFTNHI